MKQFKSKSKVDFSMVEKIFHQSPKLYDSKVCLKKPKEALDLLLDKFPGSSPEYIVENTTKILEDYHVLVLEGLSLSSQYELMLSEWEGENKGKYRELVTSTLKKDETILEEETASIKSLTDKYTELSRLIKANHGNKVNRGKMILEKKKEAADLALGTLKTMNPMTEQSVKTITYMRAKCIETK